MSESDIRPAAQSSSLALSLPNDFPAPDAFSNDLDTALAPPQLPPVSQQPADGSWQHAITGRLNPVGVFYRNGVDRGFQPADNSTLPAELRLQSSQSWGDGGGAGGEVRLWVSGTLGSGDISEDGLGTGSPITSATLEAWVEHPVAGRLTLGQGSMPTNFVSLMTGSETADELASPRNVGPLQGIGGGLHFPLVHDTAADFTTAIPWPELTLGQNQRDLDGGQRLRAMYSSPEIGGASLSVAVSGARLEGTDIQPESSGEAALHFSSNRGAWDGPFSLHATLGGALEGDGPRLNGSVTGLLELDGSVVSGAFLSAGGGVRLTDDRVSVGFSPSVDASNPNSWIVQGGVEIADRIRLVGWHGEYDDIAPGTEGTRTGGRIGVDLADDVEANLTVDYHTARDTPPEGYTSYEGHMFVVSPGMRLNLR